MAADRRREAGHSPSAIRSIAGRNPLRRRCARGGLTDALRDTALDLPSGQHWVDQSSIIVDHRVALERDEPSLRVELDLGDVTAVRKGEYVRLVEDIAVETR